MADSRSKTRPTDASVEAYLAERARPEQVDDARQLMQLCGQATGAPARMWGPSIVGHGVYRYRYESGRTGEACLAGFAVRGRELVVYLAADAPDQAALLAQLGPHRRGKSCLYLKRLADVDTAVLGRLIAGSVAELRRRHPDD